MQVKEENDDHVGESGLLEAVPANRQKEKRKTSAVKVKGTQSISKFEVSNVKASKPGKLPVLDGSAIAEGKQDFHQSITKLSRKKHKTLASKVRRDITLIITCLFITLSLMCGFTCFFGMITDPEGILFTDPKS